MSGWGRDYDDDPVLTLSDIERGLSDEDRVTFAGLMLKGMAAIEEGEGGLVESLKARIAELEDDRRHTKQTFADSQKVWLEQRALVDSQRQQIADLRLALGATDGERAQALIAENEHLKERVEIQRNLIGGLQAGNRNLLYGSWRLFSRGLRSVFVDPLSATATVKAG